MKAGSLVRDINKGDYGVILAIDADLVKIAYNDETGWFSKAYVEVICK